MKPNNWTFNNQPSHVKINPRKDNPLYNGVTRVTHEMRLAQLERQTDGLAVVHPDVLLEMTNITKLLAGGPTNG